jgi:hypothetical protein
MPNSIARLRARLRTRRELSEFDRALREASPSMHYELVAASTKATCSDACSSAWPTSVPGHARAWARRKSRSKPSPHKYEHPARIVAPLAAQPAHETR